MTFFIVVKDSADASERRQKIRDQHLRELEPHVKAKRVLMGGAILDDGGNVIGSGLVAEFGSRELLDEFLHSDIYTREGVWESFEVYPFRRAV